MSKYTKVNIKVEVLEVAKKLAAGQNRSVSNYIENLIVSAKAELTGGE